MNKLVLLSVFLVGLISSIFSQNYIPFPTNNAVWVNYENVSYGATNRNDCYTSRIFTAGDTAINNYNYTRLLRISENKTGNFGFPCGTVIQAASLDTLGYFRNDSVQKKVWLKLDGIANEILLYDFDLLVGDTVPISYFDNSQIPSVNVVDSIYTENYGGVVRTVYRINRNGSCFGHKVYLIEGIGSKSSFLKPLGDCFPSSVFSVLCFSINNTTILVNNNLTMQPPCGLLSSVEKRNSTMEGQIQISPNPTRGEINITTSQAIEFAQVFNVQGQVVKKFNSPISSIDIGELDQGVYFLSVLLVDGRVHTQKIIKQ